MPGFPFVLQYRAVSHFLREGVLEDIVWLWKRRLLVEKFFGLERR
jgi:hypothetical protein